ncbi:MAG: hypothetical protein JW716_02365 [Candidatus Aenigmarchaeota archaeon]|nr:hypothetical protein [Candidatus Aenigmarchaeota archaeon]
MGRQSITVHDLSEVQSYVDKLGSSNPAEHYSVRSAESVMKRGYGLCIEKALVAAYLAEQLGHKPRILSLASSRDIIESQSGEIQRPAHSVFVYGNPETGYGTIGNSTLGSIGPGIRSEKNIPRSYSKRIKDIFGYNMDEWYIFNLNEDLFSHIDWRFSGEEITKLNKLMNKVRHRPVWD